MSKRLSRGKHAGLSKWMSPGRQREILWHKTIFVLNCGGRYKVFEKAHKGSKVAHHYRWLVNLYQKKTATSINTIISKPYIGCTKYIPARVSSTREEIKSNGYDLNLITFKTMTMAKARGISNYWTLAAVLGDYLPINSQDA